MDFEAVARDVGYRAYTTEFDVVRDVRDAMTREELATACEVAENYLQVKDGFSESLPSLAGSKFDAEELEKAAVELEQAVALAISETGIDPSETVLGFLLDNSGSVRELKAIYARAMARVCGVLDGFGFDTPVVGHTTLDWKGGQSRRKWHEAGRERDPGRLNDLMITVYKQPGQPTVDGDLRLYGLNSGGASYKENIDGEALAWMAGAMEKLPAVNKTLVFVSDGNLPNDDSTKSVNQDGYLHRHLAAVIGEIEKSDISLVKVMAVGPLTEIKDEDRPEFGGNASQASRFLRSITAAVTHALRMKFEPTPDVATPAPKM